MSKQKQWSSFREHQKQADDWREFLVEGDFRSNTAYNRIRYAKGKCLPDGGTEECPCPDAQGEKEEELEWSDQDASIATEGITGLQSVNRGLKLNLDDAAIMREYQQFLRDQKIKIMDQGKELNLSEDWKKELARQEKEAAGAIVHEEDRAPKLGKLEDLKKYPNLYKLITAALQSEHYREELFGHFKKAGFADAKDFFAASAQQQPEEPTPTPEPPGPEPPVEEPKPPRETPRGDIYVFKGRAGKGIQSQLDQQKFPGKMVSPLLKSLRTDLEAAGYNVLEAKRRRGHSDPNVPREVIALPKTLDVLKQLPAEWREKAKKVVVAMLRDHDVKLDDATREQLKQMSVEKPQAAATQPGTATKAGDTYKYSRQGGQVQTQVQGSSDEEEEKEKQRKAKKTPTNGAPRATMPRAEGLDKEDQALLENWQRLAGIIKG